MMNNRLKQFIGVSFRNNKWFLITAALVFVLILVFSFINGRFHSADFGVYYYACKAMLSGEEVYGVAFGSSMTGYYKYSPSVLFLYIPSSLLGFKLASVINYFLQSIFATFSVFIIVNIIKTYFSANTQIRNINLFLVFILSLTFINRDIQLGNVNMFLLFIICAALVFSLYSKYRITGFLLGVAFLFKPYLILIGLPFLRKERYKALIYTAITVMVLSLLPFLYYGFSGGVEIYRDWVSAMLEHDSYIISPFTFNSLISKYFYDGETVNLTYFILAGVFIFYVLRSVYLFIRQNNRQQKIGPDQLFLFECFTLLALVPNLVNTDLQQFVYALPLVAFILNYLVEKKSYVLIISAVIIFFFYTIDQPDILGQSLAGHAIEYGLRGLSNIAIIIFAWVLLLKDTRTKTATTV